MTLDYSTMLHQSRLGCTALALAVELPAVLHSFPLLCREGRGGGLVFNFQFLTRTQISSTAVFLQKVRSSTLQTGWFQKRFFILGIFSYLPLYRQSKLKLWKKTNKCFTSEQLALAMSSKNLHPWSHNEQTGQAPGSVQQHIRERLKKKIQKKN